MDKSSRVYHNESIWKAAAVEKLAKKSTKKLHFPQFSQQSQAFKHPGLPSSRPNSGKRTPLFPPLAPGLLFHHSDMEGGSSFEGFLPPWLQVGGVLGQHWNS